MTSLQHALRSLCSKTGWCYAVFWKLKRRSRMMLTWEDGYCDYSRSSGNACSSVSRAHCDMGGNPLDQGGSGDLEGQISLAVARMSYYVYSMGEGVIGKVAFTGKYQWAFHDVDNHMEITSGCNLNGQSSLDKNPEGWQNQFAAGIKTIAVIAVSQGVVQLGSTKLIEEDSKWIDHVKSVFSTLQTAPSSLRSEVALEGQGTRSSFANKSSISGTNTCPPISKSLTVRQNQILPRKDGDPLEFQKLRTQIRPAVVANFSEGHTSGGMVISSRAVSQELQFQQLAKALIEPQYVKYSPGVGVSQQTQRNVNGIQYAMPSTGTKSVPPPNSLGSPSMDGFRLGSLKKESMQQSFVNDSLSIELCDASRGDQAVSMCGANPCIDELSSHMQEAYFVKNTLAKEETFSRDMLRGGLQQDQPDCSNTEDTSLKSASFSCAAGGIINEEHVPDNAYITPANMTCIPAKFLTTSSKTDPGGVPFVLRKPGIYNKEGGCTLCGDGGQNDLNVLEELEKLLSSFSKEDAFNPDSSFAIGDELSQALGPTFWKGGLDELQKLGNEKNGERVLNKAENVSALPAALVSDWDPVLGGRTTCENLTVPQPLEGKPELLLDAVVGAAPNYHSLNREANISFKGSFRDRCVDAPSITQETQPMCNSSLSRMPLMQTAGHHNLQYSDNTAGASRIRQSHHKLCVSTDTQMTMSVQSWTDDGHSLKSDDTQRTHSQSKRSEELSKSSKKRSRSGESVRPRPKDRQQIQDRVRELRDIVPSGSKCSIDALLEKTIKHMLFLRSVTLHAEQLKNIGQLKEDPESGATWAFDLGSEEKQIPIIVKDLNQPRHMLVEMVCEESGLFLETADIIRHLGLRILRGSMDPDGDRYWARFIVEANCEIQRVDVLVSLIQRLHLENNSSSSSMTMVSQSTAANP